MSKRKSADANALGVDDPKQGRQCAYRASMFGAKKKCSVLRGIRGGIGWDILLSLMQLFAFLSAILNLKLKESFVGCVVNQLLLPMIIVIKSMLLK